MFKFWSFRQTFPSKNSSEKWSLPLFKNEFQHLINTSLGKMDYILLWLVFQTITYHHIINTEKRSLLDTILAGQRHKHLIHSIDKVIQHRIDAVEYKAHHPLGSLLGRWFAVGCFKMYIYGWLFLGLIRLLFIVYFFSFSRLQYL